MKKLLLIILILFIIFGGYVLYDNYKDKGIPILKTEEEVINIDKLFIYGNHLNLHGNLIDDNNLQLVLYNGEFIEYNINVKDNEFNLSDYVNEGITLEDIPIGTYSLFLRSKDIDDKGEDSFKYYTLNNTTKYKETEYYTFSNVGNKIIINSDDTYNTLAIKVIENDNDSVYDIVIDPGHGGMDSGAIKNGNRESDFTMKIALDLKEKMETYGIKVKLTREDGQLTRDDLLPNYGVHGRAVIPYEVKAKYLFSIHLNSNTSTKVGGLEIYTADNINYDFAKEMASNILQLANAKYSKNLINKVSDGIYTRTFSENDIQKSIKEYNDKKMNPYDITTKSNYYFMIRETGGITTGAYVDDRNEEIDGNPYFSSNVGCETYLLELAYLTSVDDLNNINNNMSKYTEAIASTFKQIFEK